MPCKDVRNLFNQIRINGFIVTVKIRLDDGDKRFVNQRCSFFDQFLSFMINSALFQSVKKFFFITSVLNGLRPYTFKDVFQAENIMVKSLNQCHVSGRQKIADYPDVFSVKKIFTFQSVCLNLEFVVQLYRHTVKLIQFRINSSRIPLRMIIHLPRLCLQRCLFRAENHARVFTAVVHSCLAGLYAFAQIQISAFVAWCLPAVGCHVKNPAAVFQHGQRVEHIVRFRIGKTF